MCYICIKCLLLWLKGIAYAYGIVFGFCILYQYIRFVLGWVELIQCRFFL